MAYQILFLKDIPELKSRRGNAITPLLGVILGVGYPIDEAVAAYEWQDDSIAVSDDYQTVASLIGSPDVGRWSRVDLSQIPQVNSDWNATSGPARILNKPTIVANKRIDGYAGVTDSNGLYTVTYPTPFPDIPFVQPEPPLSANQTWVKVSSTTTGFSLRLVQRAAVTLLSTEVLLAATTNVAGASARVAVIAS